MNEKIKIFMGGTCEGYDWRSKLVDLLDDRFDCFNPIVDDWNDEARANEIYQREHCDLCLYVITPDMKGCYSIAEVVDDSNKRPANTVFIVLYKVYDEHNDIKMFGEKMERSLKQVENMVEKNKGLVFKSLEEFAMTCNSMLYEYNKEDITTILRIRKSFNRVLTK